MNKWDGLFWKNQQKPFADELHKQNKSTSRNSRKFHNELKFTQIKLDLWFKHYVCVCARECVQLSFVCLFDKWSPTNRERWMRKEHILTGSWLRRKGPPCFIRCYLFLCCISWWDLCFLVLPPLVFPCCVVNISHVIHGERSVLQKGILKVAPMGWFFKMGIVPCSSRKVLHSLRI